MRKEGNIDFEGQTYCYWMKVYQEGSMYGIEEGRISKIMIKRDEEIVCNYDRGWDLYPIDYGTQRVLEKLYFSEL